METPSAYIPIDRRLALCEGRDLAERSRGSALFADISGFTPLTEMLARQLGPRRGAEELTQQLNHVYEALITELHRYGGSVIGFSGDAITCWLDGDDGLRGVASAMAMQTVMEQFANIRFGEEMVTLALKTAVVTGPVRRFVVGDPNYMLLDILAGNTLVHLAMAEHQADKGDVIIDEATAVHLSQAVQISAWRTDEESGQRFAVLSGLNTAVPAKLWPTSPSNELSDSESRSWLLAAVYQRLQAGQGAYLAELRPVAALFLRFDGIDYDDDEDAPQKLDQFVRKVEHILGRYEGSLLQLTVGDKGSYLYAAMGAPIAHEDNVDRLLRVAWELQALPAQLPFLKPIQIGVTHGRMYSGAYGGEARRTYGVLGDAVNLSARLMQAAQPGQILVNDEAYNRAGNGFNWEDLPDIRVKGKSEPIVLHRLSGIKTQQAVRSLTVLYPEPPIGRQESLAFLADRLDKLLKGQGQVVRMVGEAGMGKTHVTAQFTRQAQSQAARIGLGTCQSMTRNTPYSVWRNVFFALLNLNNEQNDWDENQAIEQLTAFFSQHHPDWLLRLPLLGDLLELPIPDNPTTAALESDMRQKSLFSLVVEMLQNWAAAEPIIIILENAHWMDEASQALTETVAQQAVSTAPIMLLLPHRPELVGNSAPMPGLAKLPYFTALVLEPMSDEEVTLLLSRQLAKRPSSLLLTIVQTLAQGNPFFIHELVAAMRQGQQIVENDTHWEVSPTLLRLLQRADFVTQQADEWQLKSNVDLSTVTLGLPDSIHGLVLSQLDQLPEAHKLTLKVSSVLGYYIDLILVTEVHPDDKNIIELEAEASYMEAEEVVHEEIPDRKIYTFRHHTTQEVTYQTLLHSQRQQLHQAVAASLADQHPDAVMQIAHHAFLGEAWSLALHYNLLAGQNAKQLYANQQSIDFLQKALTSAQSLPQTETNEQLKQVHLALGELMVTTGQYDIASEHLDEALALAQADGDWKAETRCYRWYGRSHELRGEYAEALTWLDKGFAALQDKTSIEKAEMFLIAGLINIRQGAYEEALQLCQSSLEIGQALNDAAIKARTYNLMGICELRGNSTSAIERFTQSLALYEQLDNMYGQATSHNLIANGHFSRSEWRQADHHYRHSLNLFTQIGDIYNQVSVNNNLGGIALKQGRLDAAFAYYQRAIRLMGQIGGSLYIMGVLQLNMGNTYVKRQDYKAAVASLQIAQSYIEQANVRQLMPELLYLFAETDWKQGKLETAVTQAQQSLDLARELAMPQEEGYALRILGEIAHAQEAGPQAEQFFQESNAILERVGDEYEQAKTQLSLAKLYVVEGKTSAAETSLTASEAIFARLEAQLDLEAVYFVRNQLAI